MQLYLILGAGAVLAYFVSREWSKRNTNYIKPGNKPQYSSNLQELIEQFGLRYAEKLDLVAQADGTTVQVFAKQDANHESPLATLTDKELSKKVKKGKVYAKVASIAGGTMKIEFFGN